LSVGRGDQYAGWEAELKHLAIMLIALTLAGCAAKSVAIGRPDSQPVNKAQLEHDKTACKGEAVKASVLGGPRSEMKAVFDGCMAQRGYFTQR
jgi:hypothetical protein